MEERPKPPFANVVCGSILYWVCIIATILCMIGPCISILYPEHNVANPYLVFTAVWEGNKADKIWELTAEGGKYPGAHYWVEHLTKGDGITQLGAWLGCCCALPAAFFAGIAFLAKRTYGWWLISWWISFVILFAMMGIIKMK